MPRARSSVLLLAALSAVACSERQLVITVAGQDEGLRWLRATVTLNGREARGLDEFAGGSQLLGLTLPEEGQAVVELDALSADRCSVARGAAAALVSAGTVELTVPLRRLAAPSCCSAAGWCWDNPLPTGADFRDVWAAAADDLWIAGEDGGLWRYGPKGLQPVPLGTTATLLALTGTGPGDVWAAGEDGALFHYDGQRWDARDAGTTSTLTALWASGPGELWVAATDGLLHLSGGSWQRLPPTGLVSLWGSGRDLWGVSDRGAIVHHDGTGTTTTMPLPGRRLNGIWGSGPADIWAVGQSGALLHYDGGGWDVVAMSGSTWLSVWGRRPGDVWIAGESASQHFDGTRWEAVAIGPAATLFSLWGGPDFGPVAVGSMGTVRRFEGGAWNALSPAASPIGQAEALRAVWGASPADLWAVGTTGRATGLQGLIAHYDGVAWSRSLETTGRLYDLSGRGADAWAVGAGGALLRYRDGRWMALGSQIQGALRGVWAAPEGAAEELWAVGDLGTVLRSRGGVITQVPVPTGRDLYAVWGAAADDVWAVGQWGAVLHWNGKDWRADPGTDELSRGTLLRAVWGSGPGDVFVAGDGGLILHRQKGHWVSELSGAREDLQRLFGTGPADVWAAGGAVPPGRASALLHFDGQGWSRVGTGTGRLALFGLFGSLRTEGPGRVFAVGASGGVLRYRSY